MSCPIIEIRDLWFSFNGIPVVREVNLSVHKGDFLALFGPNGGGKTTLLKLMLGLLKPERGTVYVFGEPPGQTSHSIGYMAQHVHFNENLPISVLDAVLMGRLWPGRGWSRYTRKDKIAVQRVLERVEMWEYRSCRIGELSGGQQQRVFMARALVDEPELLFLDEPTVSVDTRRQTDLFDILKELSEGVTIIVVSHDVSIVSRHVKSIAWVNQRVSVRNSARITGEMLEMDY